MNNPFSLRANVPQGSSHIRDVLNYQAVGMYDEQLVQHHSPKSDSSAFISHRTAAFEPDLYAQNQPEYTLQSSEQLLTLRRSYILVSESSLIAEVLARVPVLYLLLKAAVEPLRVSFGSRKLLVLEALTSDEGITLRVIVKLSHDTENPATLMRKFKQDWWLKNCSQSEASLVFDYEMGNGF